MRSLSSCLDVARDGAGELGKDPLDEIEPGAVRRSESEFEAARGRPQVDLRAKLWSLGDVRGVIVEDQLDRCMSRIGGIEKIEEFDEFAAAEAILDQGVDLAGEQIDAGQQADGAVALVFIIAREGRMDAGFGRQIRCRRCDRLDTGLLVIGNDRHRIVRLLLRSGRGLLDNLDLAVDAQNLRHLLFEFGVAARSK